MTLDVLSAISVKLDVCFNSTVLSAATGFFYARNNRDYLVTNWHVVSGRDPRTGQPLNNLGSVPNNIRLNLHTKNPLEFRMGLSIELYNEHGFPCWMQHKNHGQSVDIAIIDFEIDKSMDYIKIYSYHKSISDDALRYVVGNDVFIIGFPRGIGIQGLLPIWKRASIASEPVVGIDDRPGFLVDTATREGMSGSPVYRRTWGAASFENGSELVGPGDFTRLLGVYSGRHGGNDEFLAQLGRVWSSSLIDEIIDDPVSGIFELK
jgi:hypothetical protein